MSIIRGLIKDSLKPSPFDQPEDHAMQIPAFWRWPTPRSVLAHRQQNSLSWRPNPTRKQPLVSEHNNLSLRRCREEIFCA